jgi:hypothetical protein
MKEYAEFQARLVESTEVVKAKGGRKKKRTIEIPFDALAMIQGDEGCKNALEVSRSTCSSFPQPALQSKFIVHPSDEREKIRPNPDPIKNSNKIFTFFDNVQRRAGDEGNLCHRCRRVQGRL